MRVLILLMITFGLLVIASSSGRSTTNAIAQTAHKFTSSYTPLTSCGSGMTKKEEREAEKNGSDIPTRCKGFGGYDVYIYYSACSSHFSLTRGDENISLGTQAINWKQKTVEWRMADGKPFAVIMRVYEYAGDDLCATNGKVKSESLMVQGLKGFEHIQETVDARVPNANVQARELADHRYLKPKR